MAETKSINLSQRINHAPAKVWEALTIPELFEKWWGAADIKPVVGHSFSIDMGRYGRQSCEVLEVEEGRMISYSFAPNVIGTTVTWRLNPEGEGTLLELEHSGFNTRSIMGGLAYSGMVGGWPRLLERIETAI